MQPIVIARLIRDALQDVPGLAHVGVSDRTAVATYGPGEFVPGIAVSVLDGTVEIAIELCAIYAPCTSFRTLATHVRRLSQHAISQQFPDVNIRKIDIMIADVQAG